ncbi:UNVERIFIED_CONTAM: hypothetical protein Sangu_2772100 [Sesamum angustifolium]|uniref:DUF4283 domain-containing protein n=1 Tax=Sesamum angustifolium TaxID=2727405 RepID=A0AAW2IU29_9LAMI
MVLLQGFASLDPNNEISYCYSTILPIVFVVSSSFHWPENLCMLVSRSLYQSASFPSVLATVGDCLAAVLAPTEAHSWAELCFCPLDRPEKLQFQSQPVPAVSGTYSRHFGLHTCCICQRLPCLTCATTTADFAAPIADFAAPTAALCSIYSRPLLPAAFEQHLQPTLQYLQPPFAACCCCLLHLSNTYSHPLQHLQPPFSMAKKEKAKKQATSAGRQSTVTTTAAAATATAATATAEVKDNTKATSFQAFISDLEASPSFPLSHASAGNALGRQEEQPGVNGGKTEATVSVKPSFAGLFSTNRKFTMENKLSKFHIEDGTITLESDDLTDVRAKLGFCIVGYIAGKFPGMQAIRALSKTWGASFQQHDSGWLVFRFARDDDRQRILAGGPYFIYGRPLLKPMPDCFEFKEDDISLTPVWATLPSLPLECWHPNASGRSALGWAPHRYGLPHYEDGEGLLRPHLGGECNRFGHHKSSCGDNQQPTTAAACQLPLLLLVNLLPINSLLRRRHCRPNGLSCSDDKKQSTNSHRLQAQNRNRKSTNAAEQKTETGHAVTEQGQQILTDNMADGVQERPESSKPQTSPKGQRQSNTLRQKKAAEVDSSASSCESDSPASTQHLMPGTTAYEI